MKADDRWAGEEAAIRLRIDKVLQDIESADLEDEYKFLADAYRSLNRKIYKIMLISDLYQADRIKHPSFEKEKKSQPTRQSDTHLEPTDEYFEVLQFADGLKDTNAKISNQVVRLVKRVRKTERRLSKVTAISDRFQDLLQQSNKNKDFLISNVSHELRNPLGSVLGLIDLLYSSGLNEKQRELLDILSRSADRLQHIINDILDLSRAEAGWITIERKLFHLKERLLSLIEEFRHHRLNHEVALDLVVEPDVPEMVYCDPFRLAQVLSNLISNAIKFTKHGKVELRVSRFDVGHLRFDVVDTGIGIDKERMSSLFQRFIQEDSSIERQFGGTGLGLSIVRELIEKMNGKILVTSEKGVGSIFSVILPLADPPQQEQAQVNIQTRILVVEDSPEQQWLLAHFLQAISAQATFVGSAKEAVDMFANYSFDIVLLDLQLPDQSGYELLYNLRQIGNGQTTPMIAVTGTGGSEERQRMIDAGFDAHIIKPYTQAHLLDTLQNYL